MRDRSPPPIDRPLPTPRDMESYAIRFHANQRMTGFGVGNVYCHVPCPFCAAAEFMVWEVLDCRAVMEKGATCIECDRSAKGIFTDGPGSVTFEVVQTGGPAPPEWLEPKLRRLS